MSSDYNKTFPVRWQDLKQLVLPTPDWFRKKGGRHFSILRDLIQRRSPGGEHITWGSNDKVSLTSHDLEEMVVKVAAAAVDTWLSDQLSEAGDDESREDWPGWKGYPGLMQPPRGYKTMLDGGNEDQWYFFRRSEKEKLYGDDVSNAPFPTYIDACAAAWKHADKVWESEVSWQGQLETRATQKAIAIIAEEMMIGYNHEVTKDFDVLNSAKDRLFGRLQDYSIPFLNAKEISETLERTYLFNASTYSDSDTRGACNMIATSMVRKFADSIEEARHVDSVEA